MLAPGEMSALRRRARNPNAGISEVRPLTTADLARLKDPVPPVDVTRIRDIHHTMAYMFAMDMPNTEIAERLGISYNRIATLRSAPSVLELTNNYRAHRQAARLEHIDEFERNAIANKRKAERILETFLDTIEESDRAPDLPTARFVERLATNRMDRFGYGKTSTNVNVNVDFAKKLEAAIARSQPKVIEQ